VSPTRAPSRRYPWLRGGLYGLIAALGPFTWVVEVDGCGHAPPVATELTGVEVAARVEPEGWAVVVPVLLVAIAMPFLAARASAGWSALVQAVGLAASGFIGYVTWFALFFSIFTERSLKSAGWLVAGTAVATVLEAVVRTAEATREWWLQRPRATAPPPDR
jgi:hypothetical protein